MFGDISEIFYWGIILIQIFNILTKIISFHEL